MMDNTVISPIIAQEGHSNLLGNSQEASASANSGFASGQVSVDTKNYILNTEKTWQKLAQAASRDQPVSIEVTGGGVNLTFQAGVFLHFRKAAFLYYSQPISHNLEVEPISAKDLHDNDVGATIKVKYKKNSSTCYTVNFYNSKSKIMTNGKGLYSRFFKTDIKSIMQTMNSDVNLGDCVKMI